MAFAQQRLNEYGVTYRCMPLACNLPLALEDASVDVIASLYSLEHLYTLHSYLDDFKRLPKSESCLIGTIPVEGGLAWGGGQCLSRAGGSKTRLPSIPTRSFAGNSPTLPITSWTNSIRCSSAKSWAIGRYSGYARSTSI